MTSITPGSTVKVVGNATTGLTHYFKIGTDVTVESVNEDEYHGTVVRATSASGLGQWVSIYDVEEVPA